MLFDVLVVELDVRGLDRQATGGINQTGTTIGRANLNGTDVNESFITGAHAPAGLTVSGAYIYWSNFGSSHGINGTTIGRAALNGSAADQSFITGAKSPVGLTVAPAA